MATNPDFIATYFPELDEIDSATLQAARSRVVTYLSSKYPDLDMRPNSVFGDLVVSPYAYMLAALEESHGRFMSDLDLENVANGTIYNCDFITGYLKNFAVVDQAHLQSSGVVRLIFCDDASYTIDRSTRFKFGDDEFSMRLPHSGSLSVLPVGSSTTAYENTYVLSQLTAKKWAVDVPVVGTMTTLVEKGDEAEINTTVTDLEEISAVADFEFGLPPDSLATLAEKTRETFYSATLATRNGARHYLAKEFPDLTGMSPVLSGDSEAVRDSVNPLGMASGKVDLHVQSKGYANVEEQVISIPYYSQQDAVTVEKFIGELNLLNPPCYIDSITYEGDSTIDLGFRTGGIDIYSQSNNAAKAPMLTAAYSPYEDLWIAIDMPKTGATPLITPSIDPATGDQSGLFRIKYKSDPMVKVVSDIVSGRDVSPVGVDVLTKGFVPIVIDELVITYVKKSGVTMALTTAKNEIYEYFRSLGHDKLYSDSKVIDTMFYAGASDVRSITCTASVQWSVANKVLKATTTTPDLDWTTADAAAITPEAISISSSSGFIPSYIDPNIDTSNATYAVLGSRNVGYVLPKENITFNEVIL